jgi:hypothetical protein
MQQTIRIYIFDTNLRNCVLMNVQCGWPTANCHRAITRQLLYRFLGPQKLTLSLGYQIWRTLLKEIHYKLRNKSPDAGSIPLA